MFLVLFRLHFSAAVGSLCMTLFITPFHFIGTSNSFRIFFTQSSRLFYGEWHLWSILLIADQEFNQFDCIECKRMRETRAQYQSFGMPLTIPLIFGHYKWYLSIRTKFTNYCIIRCLHKLLANSCPNKKITHTHYKIQIIRMHI